MGTKGIENDARLNAGKSVLGIDFKDLIHVLAEIEDDGNIAGLSREARAGTSRKDRRGELLAGGDCGEYVVGIARDHQTDGDLAVVRSVSGVEGAATAVESHLAADCALEFVFEVACLCERIDRFCVGAERQWRV